jgi:hypothetical protein
MNMTNNRGCSTGAAANNSNGKVNNTGNNATMSQSAESSKMKTGCTTKSASAGSCGGGCK